MNRQRSAEDLRAVAHPIRLHVLRCISDGLQSPVDIFSHLVQDDPGLSLGMIAYHVRVLADTGMIQCYKTEKVRGANKHLYKLTRRGNHLLKIVEPL